MRRRPPLYIRLALVATAVILAIGCDKDRDRRFKAETPPAQRAPQIASVAPNHGPLAGGNTVQISGDYFLTQTDVFFGDKPAVRVTVGNAQNLDAVVPAGDAAGRVDVRVQTAAGSAVLSDAYRYESPLEPGPEIQSIDPAAGPLAGGNTVTIAGENFSEESRVFFGVTEALPVTVVSDEELVAVAPAGAALGFVDVRVETEVGEAVLPDGYQYVLPIVQQVTPARGPVSGGTPITIAGVWFTTVEDTAVTLGDGTVTVTAVEPTSITGIAPAASQPGTVALTVTNLYGSGTLLNAFTYDAEHGPPTIGGIEPASGPARGGTLVVLTGTGLSAPGIGATLCGVAMTDVQVVDDTMVQARTPPGALGSVCDLVVATEAGTATLPRAFTYVCDFPLVTVAFPLGGLTTAETALLQGTALDDDGIASIRVNGAPVETSDGYAHFQRLLPLLPGTNDFVIAAEDSLGCAEDRAAEFSIVRLTVEPVDGPVGLTALPSTGEVVYTDHVQRAIFAIDPESGARRVIKQPIPAWDIDYRGTMFDLCYQSDLWELPIAGGNLPPRLGRVEKAVFRAIAREAADAVLATSDSHGAVFRITTGPDGSASPLSDAETGTGPPLVKPHGIMRLANGTVIATDFAANRILRIDPLTGDRQILSGDGVGDGPALLAPGPLLQLDGARLVVATSDPEINLLAVDLTTGDRSVLSGAKRGAGPKPKFSIDLALHPAFDVELMPAGDIIMSDPATPAIFRVNPETGDRLTIVSGSYGAGPKLNRPQALTATDDGIYVAERTRGELFLVNAQTSNRTLASGDGVGSGPFVSFATGVARCGGMVFIAGQTSANILKVDLATGNRSVVADGAIGAGPDLVGPAALCCQDAATLLVADASARAVYRVDVASGDRTLVSGPDLGSGPELIDLSGITLAATRIIVTTWAGAVVEIQPTTGARTLVAQVPLSTGTLTGVAALPNGALLLIANRALHVLASGSTTPALLSGAGTGLGPNLVRATGVATDAFGRIFVTDYTRACVFQIQRDTGDRILFSR